MESLSETQWDVVIDGTGLQQSLLALALSRSNKKVLHVDRNDYYGGSEAAFSLQEADEWVKRVNDGTERCFPSAEISQTPVDDGPKLSFSRAYTLTLSPQIIYTRAQLLTNLVSSKVHKQLEFQAVGSWWIYSKPEEDSSPAGSLSRLPNGREDIFADSTIDNRAKRVLMKFLKFVVDYEEQTNIWGPYADKPLSQFLSEEFKLPENLQVVMLALTLSLDDPAHTNVEFSLPRISRHLTSIGLFGPGFGAVYPKWGGSAEIAQVACRAGAVGGGVYVLGSGIKSQELLQSDTPDESGKIQVSLGNGEVVKTKMVITAVDEEQGDYRLSGDAKDKVYKTISIIASPLTSLFESTTEGSPSAAVSVVIFPSMTLSVNSELQTHPVYIMAHSADTGECPQDQTILYATTKSNESASSRLNAAISTFLATFTTAEFPSPPKVLYTLSYVQHSEQGGKDGKTFKFPSLPSDLACSDEMLHRVDEAWQVILSGLGGNDDARFMEFEEREGMVDDGDESGY